MGAKRPGNPVHFATGITQYDPSHPFLRPRLTASREATLGKRKRLLSLVSLRLTSKGTLRLQQVSGPERSASGLRARPCLASAQALSPCTRPKGRCPLDIRQGPCPCTLRRRYRPTPGPEDTPLDSACKDGAASHCSPAFAFVGDSKCYQFSVRAIICYQSKPMFFMKSSAAGSTDSSIGAGSSSIAGLS